MRALELRPYVNNVTLHRKTGRLEISVSGHGRFYFRYDNEQGHWREYLASCPIGSPSTDQRVEANGILNGFLGVLQS